MCLQMGKREREKERGVGGGGEGGEGLSYGASFKFTPAKSSTRAINTFLSESPVNTHTHTHFSLLCFLSL